MLGPALKDKVDSSGIHKELGNTFKTWEIQTDQDLFFLWAHINSSVLNIFLISLFHFDVIKEHHCIKNAQLDNLGLISKNFG